VKHYDKCLIVACR